MRGALGITVGTLFRGDSRLCPDLETMLCWLTKSATQMQDWCFFIAFEGAHQVFAGVRTMTRGRAPRQFFEEVSEDALYAAGAYDLQEIIKMALKADGATS